MYLQVDGHSIYYPDYLAIDHEKQDLIFRLEIPYDQVVWYIYQLINDFRNLEAGWEEEHLTYLLALNGLLGPPLLPILQTVVQTIPDLEERILESSHQLIWYQITALIPWLPKAQSWRQGYPHYRKCQDQWFIIHNDLLDKFPDSPELFLVLTYMTTQKMLYSNPSIFLKAVLIFDQIKEYPTVIESRLAYRFTWDRDYDVLDLERYGPQIQYPLWRSAIAGNLINRTRYEIYPDWVFSSLIQMPHIYKLYIFERYPEHPPPASRELEKSLNLFPPKYLTFSELGDAFKHSEVSYSDPYYFTCPRDQHPGIYQQRPICQRELDHNVEPAPHLEGDTLERARMYKIKYSSGWLVMIPPNYPYPYILTDSHSSILIPEMRILIWLKWPSRD